MFKSLEKIFYSLENNSSKFIYWVLFFLGIIFIRNILESFLEMPHNLMETGYFVQYALWYGSFALSIILLLAVFIREKTEKISKAVIAFFSLVIAVPVIDYLISCGKGFTLRYINDGFSEVARKFLSFGAGSATIGQQMMVAVCILVLFLYVFYKSRNIGKALACGFFSYCIFFFYAALPSFLNFFYRNIKIGVLDYCVEVFLAFAVLAQFAIWAFFCGRGKFKALVKSIVISRSAHYVAMVFLGAVICIYANGVNFNAGNFLLSAFAVFFAFQFAVISNNYFDGELKKELKEIVFEVCLVYLLFAVLFAFLVSLDVLLLVFGTVVLSVLYSAPPLRLKKLGFMNNFFIAAASWIAATIGYAGQSELTGVIPFSAMVIVSYFLAAHYKDLKDAEKDAKNKIMTIPAIFGAEKGRKIVSLLAFCAYISVPLLTGILELLIPAFVFGVLGIYAMEKRKADERLFFGLYFAFFCVLCAYLLLL